MYITFTIKLDTQYNKLTTNEHTTPSDLPNKADEINKSMTIDEAHQIATKVQGIVIRSTGAARVIIYTEPL